MNAGHSAANALFAKPSVTYVSFDIKMLRWSNITSQFLDRVFPGRFVSVPGSSLETLPAYANGLKIGKYTRICDVLSVDGDHGGDAPYRDIVNGRALSRPGGIVLIDDWIDVAPSVKDAWSRAKREGVLKEVACIDPGFFVGEYRKAWCAGIYI